ncbi:hypothetical protein RKE29_04590 [Streptomyces sp. B1866]|uniref:hypothetical protein n=1 Tax=Streptomyces sp. B1866 TaxID=3075431 RepID=UPI00288F04A8|nr:hypothetical protein [Streptomyces sp. B1866]MDT3395927.1 hypothetical protein [Streptomyces sp. B1866]
MSFAAASSLRHADPVLSQEPPATVRTVLGGTFRAIRVFASTAFSVAVLGEYNEHKYGPERGPYGDGDRRPDPGPYAEAA